jgi:hypothetical protein
MNEVSISTAHTASPEVATPDEFAVPLRECAPWCVEGDGHPNEHPADRYCSVNPRTVALSLSEPYESEGAWFLSSVDLYMTRERNEDEPRFVLSHDGMAGIRFTENELRQLLGAGLLLLDKAEAGRS